MLRKHQREFFGVINGIIQGSSVKNIIVKATPGSGKSMIPLLAGKLITAGLADKLFWVCPRMSLQYQAERNFLDPFFRKMFDHRLSIRASTNEFNPARGTDGAVSTYQAIGVDSYQTVLEEFRKRRYILILDEYHHAEENGEWTKAIRPLYEQAAFRVLMSGTLSRGDQKKIAFTPYLQSGESFFPNLKGDSETSVIEYSRRDALAERAIIPLNFIFSDGMAKWEKKTGKVVESRISTQNPQDSNHALYTALHTEYAFQLLTEAVSHWKRDLKNSNPNAQLLVVSASIEKAKEYTEYLRNIGEKGVRIATSDDGPECVKAIKDFKAGRFGILISCQVAYEGLDCPAISHIACLTRIRTSEWIEQCVCRANRIDPQAGPYESQRGFIFAPQDQAFLEIVNKIKADQASPAIYKNGNGNGKARAGETDLFGEPITPGGITPLSSEMTDRHEIDLTGIQGCREFPLTPSEREGELLERIEDHVRKYSFRNRHNPKHLNAELRAVMQKPRREMTIPELESCLSYVRDRYPLDRIRGTGRRVPTKAQPFACTWKE